MFTLRGSPPRVWLCWAALAVLGVAVDLVARALGVDLSGGRTDLGYWAHEIALIALETTICGTVLHILLVGRAPGFIRPWLAVYLALALFYAGVAWAASEVIGGAADVEPMLSLAFVALGVAMLLLLTALHARVLLWLTALLIGRQMTLRQSWVQMSGVVWPYVGTSLLLLFPVLPAFVFYFNPVGPLGITGSGATIVLDRIAYTLATALTLSLGAVVYERYAGLTPETLVEVFD